MTDMQFDRKQLPHNHKIGQAIMADDLPALQKALRPYKGRIGMLCILGEWKLTRNFETFIPNLLQLALVEGKTKCAYWLMDYVEVDTMSGDLNVPNAMLAAIAGRVWSYGYLEVDNPEQVDLAGKCASKLGFAQFLDVMPGERGLLHLLWNDISEYDKQDTLLFDNFTLYILRCCMEAKKMQFWDHVLDYSAQMVDGYSKMNGNNAKMKTAKLTERDQRLMKLLSEEEEKDIAACIEAPKAPSKKRRLGI